MSVGLMTDPRQEIPSSIEPRLAPYSCEIARDSGALTIPNSLY